MPVLEPVVAILKANVDDFLLNVEKARATMATMPEAAAAAGAETSAALDASAAAGAAKFGTAMDAAGVAGGGAIATGVKDSAAAVGSEAEKLGEDAGSRFSATVGKLLEKSGSSLGGLSLPLGNAAKGIERMGDEAKKSKIEAGTFFDTLATTGRIAALGLGVGFAGAATHAVHLADSMQQTDTQVANSAAISQDAATKIGNAMLGTMGSTEFSGQELAKAYSGVAGQLRSAEGHALSTADAMDFMSTVSEVAGAKQMSLASATKAVAGAMQAYQVPAKETETVTTAMFNASNATGQSIQGLGSQLGRIHTMLGAVAPSIGETASLMVDLANHGESGRASISAVNQFFMSGLKPVTEYAKAQRELTVTTDALPASLRSLADQVKAGTITSTDATKAAGNMGTENANLFASFMSAEAGMTKAKEAAGKMGVQFVDSSGNIKPLGEIIGKLHDQISGMTKVQAIAALQADGFGSASAKLVETIQAGPAAFKAAQKATENAANVHKAAAREEATLAVQFKLVTAAVEDFLTQAGQLLVPILEKVIAVGIKVIKWIADFKPALIALGVVIGGFLTVTIGAFLIQLANKWATAMTTAGEQVTGFGKKIFGVSSEVAPAEEATNIFAESIDNLAKVVAAATGAIVPDTERMAAGVDESMIAMSEGATAAAATTETAMEGMAAVTEETAAATDVAIGSTGIGAIFLGLGIAVTLLATHWKTVWGWIKDAVGIAVSFVKSHLVIFAAVFVALIGPIGLVVVLVIKYWHQLRDATVAVWHFIYQHIHGTVQLIGAVLKAMFGFVKLYFSAIKTEVTSVIDIVVGIIQVGWDYIVGLFHIFGDILTGHWGKLWTDIKNMFSNIWHHITGTVVKVGRDIIHGLIDGLKNAATSLPHVIGNIAKGLLHSFTSFFGIASPSKVFAGYGKNMMEGLSKGIKDSKELVSEEAKGLKFGKALEKEMWAISRGAVHMGNTMKFAASGFVAIAQGGQYAEGHIKPAANAIERIGKALEKAGGLKMSKSFGDELKSLSTIATKLNPGAMERGITALKDGLHAIAAANIGHAIAADARSLDTLTKHLKPADEAMKEFGKASSSATAHLEKGDKMLKGIADSLGKADKSSGELSKRLRDISHELNTMGHAVKTATDALGDKLQKALYNDALWATVVQPVFKKIADVVVHTAGRVKDTVKDWNAFGDKLKRVEEHLKDLEKSLHAIAVSTGNAAKSSRFFANHLDDMSKEFKETADDSKIFVKRMEDFKDKIKEVANRTGDFRDSWKGDWSKVADSLQDAWTRMGKSFTSLKTDGFDKIISQLNNLATQWAKAWGEITSYTDTLTTQLVNDFRGLGKNVVQGVIDGLNSKKTDLNDTLTRVMQDAVNSAKDSVKVKSPSQVFHDIGRNMMEGLANGINDHSGLAGTALSDLGTSLSGNFVFGAARGAGSAAQSTTILNVTTPIEINGQTLANIVTQYQLRGARSTGNALGRYSGGNQTGTATNFNVNAISR